MRHRIRIRLAALVTSVVAATLVTAVAAQAQQPAGEITAAQAEEALENAEEALAPDPPPVPATPEVVAPEAPDATAALNELAASYGQLQGKDRRRARGLLARPTDGAADLFGDGYPAGAPVGSAESPHFCVHWVEDPSTEDAPSLLDADGVADFDGIPDYVEAVLAIAEYSYSIEVAPGALGWEPPKPDKAGCGANPGAHADVYLKQLGSAGVFGYESPDPGQGNARSQYGYMVIDDDFALEEYGYPDPLDPAKVTFAHEFNHLLQQNYNSLQDLWMFESTATWAENHVYPAIDDWVFYLSSFASEPDEPITDPRAGGRLRIYGAAVWNHWLDSGGGGYGVGAIRSAWELSDTAKPRDNAIAAYDAAIRKAGGKGFSREFVEFAVATSEWKAGFGGFVDADRYPDVKRHGSLSASGARRVRLDHAAYRLLDVRRGSRAMIKLEVCVEDGVRSGIALVGRRGKLASGAVKAKTRYLPDGGFANLTLRRLDTYDRVTAVLVNADGRVEGFDPAKGWIYSRDRTAFELSHRSGLREAPRHAHRQRSAKSRRACPG